MQAYQCKCSMVSQFCGRSIYIHVTLLTDLWWLFSVHSTREDCRLFCLRN